MMTPALKELITKTGLAGGVFFVAIFVIVLPKFMMARRLSMEVQKTFQENRKIQTLILTVKNSGDRLEVIQKKLEQYKKRALRQEDLTEMLDTIGSQAQGMRLNVLSLQALDEPRRIPGEVFMDGGFEIQQLRIALKAEGEYSDLRRYFDKLEELPYEVRIQTILLKNTSAGAMEKNKEPILSMEVTLGVLMRFQKSKALEGGSL